ncbi:adenylyltransferase/cytidyltransferase family protein [Saccharopolyspora hirsuta]|uniref:Adenylyltransferase/cytidyltransferase family protein n=1 Tax=Saccharopolyspora hirsuta TaxID=1837 RepID=A0A5M7C642_SACHI|nr:adenylyltransferase/cytidyltransferase family protein [Saccharopolyspora hirsuta]KAA5835074.1 adenylyltransferase/cytidyltransferase family protein [Saccharopolyspora hirsuta]
MSPSKKISIPEALELREQFARSGISLGMCHGCFDILHSGHIHHLSQAAKHSDRLLVSVTAAKSINKGPGRPIFDDTARTTVLAALEVVDLVVLNEELTAVPLIQALKPDHYFKGADYADLQDPRVAAEVAAVEAAGGTFVLTDGAVFDSSTRAAGLLSRTRS